MREPQDRLQDAHQRAPRAALRSIVATSEIDFGKLHVPIAVLVPDEFVDGLGREVEAIRIELRVDAFFSVLELRDNPTVGDRQRDRHRTVEADILALDIHQDEASRVP